MNAARITWVLMTAITVAYVPTARSADLTDVAAAWRSGDIAAARTSLAECSESDLASSDGTAWRLRLADDPAVMAALRPERPTQRLDAAWIAWGRNDPENASSHLAAIKASNTPPLAGADFLAGLLARKAGDIEAARNALATVRPDDPSFAWARLTLGRIAAAAGDAALARRYFDNAENAALPVCRADVLAARWELVRSANPSQAQRLERELANRFPESLPLIRIRELSRRRLAVDAVEADQAESAGESLHPAPSTGDEDRYVLQLGAFSDRSRALSFRDEWQGALGDLEIVGGPDKAGGMIYRVRLGSFPSQQRAKERSEALQREHGLASVVVDRTATP